MGMRSNGLARVINTAAMLVATMLSMGIATAAAQADVLPSWNDTPTRAAIIAFVERVSDPESPDFVPPADRIAVFDNDGNLWAENPAYFQLLFTLERIRDMAPRHPEWREEQPFKGALEGDMAALHDAGEEGLLQLLMASHAGMSSAEFAATVGDWLAEARHPRFDQPYTALIYRPMRDLLDYLAAHGFSNFIVSGGGVSFMRVWAPAAYGIPSERIIGSQIALRYVDDGSPRIEREGKIVHINDKAGKPVGIQQHIGRRPIFASGNSDGDFQMLEWTTSGAGPRFGLLLHHTDAEREWAYDRTSSVGRLDRALEAAPERGWTVIDMARDWRVVFDFQDAASTSPEEPGSPPRP